MGIKNIIRSRPSVPFTGGTNPQVHNPGFDASAGIPQIHNPPIEWKELHKFANRSTGDPLGIPVFWDCLNLIAETVATLRLDAARLDARGDVNEDLWPLPPIVENPFPAWGRSRWLGFVVRCLLLRGNAFALLGDFDADGYPRQAAPISPERMRVTMGADGHANYQIGPGGGVHRRWPAGDILHIGGYQVDDGPLGVGVLDYGMRTTEMSFRTVDFVTGGLGGSGVPSGVITVDDPDMTRERSDNIKSRWMNSHSGPVRTPAVLPSTMTFQPLSMNFTDADIAQVRSLNALDITHLFSVPSWLVNVGVAGASTTYSNAEQQQQVFKVMTLTRWTHRLEEAFTSLVPNRTEVTFDFAEMLRSTTSEQYEAWVKAKDSGLLTLDEIRRLMKRPALAGVSDVPADRIEAVVATEIEKIERMLREELANASA